MSKFKCQVEVKTRAKGLGKDHVFQTEVVPNGALSGKGLYERLARHSNLTTSMAKIYVDTIEGFILDELAEGNRVDFGLASFYPRLSGCVSTRDADPVSEGLYVRGAVKARKELMEAPRRTVEPVNRLANERPRIVAFGDTVTGSSEVIAPEHELHIYGSSIPIKTSRSDEGIWLETRRRGRVATAEVLRSSNGEAACVFHGELPRSRYTLVLGTRCGKGTDFKVRRCLWDVRVV